MNQPARVTIGTVRRITLASTHIGWALADLQRLDAKVRATPRDGKLDVEFSYPVQINALKALGFRFLADTGDPPAGEHSPPRPGA